MPTLGRPMLGVAGYKLHALPHLLDTMDLWKFGDAKGIISLLLLAGAFSMSLPKASIDGAQVALSY